MKYDPFPQRPSMVSHAIAIIRKGLNDSRWVDELPGERQLCVQIGVSRATLRKALEQLRTEGILETDHGKATRPTKRALRKVKREISASRKVLLLSPESIYHLPARLLLTIDSLRTHLSAAGHKLEVRVFHPKAEDADTAVATLSAAEPNAIFLLYQQDLETHHCFHARSLPAIVYGNQNPQQPLPAVGVDWKASTRHAANHLLRRGFPPERIALVVPTLTLPGDLDMISGLRDVLGPKAKAFELSQNPTSIPPALDRLLSLFPTPSALIFARTRHTIAALSHFSLVRHLSVPEDIAVVCLNDDPILNYFQPCITRYQLDIALATENLSSLVLRAASGANLLPKAIRLFPEFIRGATA